MRIAFSIEFATPELSSLTDSLSEPLIEAKAFR
jgi:hypothetical protein